MHLDSFIVSALLLQTIEASLRLGAKALQMVGAPADNIDLLIQGVRESGYELVREGTKGDESP